MMWYKLPLFIFLVYSLSGCLTASKPQLPEYLQHHIYQDKDLLYVHARNLTEDASVLSTQEDEVLIYLYQHLNGGSLVPLFSAAHVFSKSSPEFYEVLNLEITSDNLLLVLLEQDSDKTIEEYHDIIKTNSRQMTLHHSVKDYKAIESYLGDDDIIAIQWIKYHDNQMYIHHGSHRGDQYEYQSMLKSKR